MLAAHNSLSCPSGRRREIARTVVNKSFDAKLVQKAYESLTAVQRLPCTALLYSCFSWCTLGVFGAVLAIRLPSLIHQGKTCIPFHRDFAKGVAGTVFSPVFFRFLPFSSIFFRFLPFVSSR